MKGFCFVLMLYVPTRIYGDLGMISFLPSFLYDQPDTHLLFYMYQGPYKPTCQERRCVYPLINKLTENDFEKCEMIKLQKLIPKLWQIYEISLLIAYSQNHTLNEHADISSGARGLQLQEPKSHVLAYIYERR